MPSSPRVPRPLRLPNVAGTPRSPPAIWAAMARQGQWKSWALVLAFGLCALEALVALRLAQRPPDVVLVAPDGQSTYVNQSLAGEALVHFLAEQRQRPSDITVFHFTRDFIQHFFALDSAHADAAFAEALTMMAPGFRSRVAREAEENKLLEGIRASHTRAEVTFEAVDIVERTDAAFHVRTVILRRTERLEDGVLISADRLHVDLYASVVPRSPAHPDGLVVGQVASRAEQVEAGSVPTPSGLERAAHAH